jgi:hypothetical protein
VIGYSENVEYRFAAFNKIYGVSAMGKYGIFLGTHRPFPYNQVTLFRRNIGMANPPFFLKTSSNSPKFRNNQAIGPERYSYFCQNPIYETLPNRSRQF